MENQDSSSICNIEGLTIHGARTMSEFIEAIEQYTPGRKITSLTLAGGKIIFNRDEIINLFGTINVVRSVNQWYTEYNSQHRRKIYPKADGNSIEFLV